VGPIPIVNGVGKEIVTRFETDLKNEKVFFTDANGRQIVKRMFNTK
jgi:lysosomal alpha-mannosidase